jgi:hypothetical protein
MSKSRSEAKEMAAKYGGAKNKDGLNKRPPLAHQRAFLHVRRMY